MLALPRQAQEALHAVADPEYDDVAWHLQWVPGVNNAMAAAWNFGSAVSGVQNQYRDQDIVYLEACGNLLSKARTEPNIPPEQLQDLRTKVQGLQEDMTAAEGIPADLKSFMLERLEDVLRALREFTIRGPKALEQTLDETVGGFIRHHFESREVDPETRSWMEKFRDVLGVIAVTIGITAGLLALPAEVSAAIDGKAPSAEQSHSSTTVSPVQPANLNEGRTTR